MERKNHMARVKRAGVAANVNDRRNAIIKEWGKHRSLQQYLADRCPNEWAEIRECKTGYYSVQEDNLQPGSHRVSAEQSCHQIPWCIMCVSDEESRRRRDTINLLHRCTPGNDEPLAGHFVLESMIRNDDGTGWGNQAANDLPRFFQATGELLEEIYGEGIGWKGSYQHFGERPFKKDNPHIDFTLNGWRLQDGKPVKVQRLNIRGKGGADDLMRIQKRVLSRHFNDVEVTLPMHLGKFVPLDRYHNALKYQLREMVDLRQIRYSRQERKIWWIDYNTKRRLPYEIPEFEAGIAAYQIRYGQWGYEPEQELHRGMGHMAKGNAKKTQTSMGGKERQHPRNCACKHCGDWQRVFIEEAMDAVTAAKPLPYKP